LPFEALLGGRNPGVAEIETTGRMFGRSSHAPIVPEFVSVP